MPKPGRKPVSSKSGARQLGAALKQWGASEVARRLKVSAATVRRWEKNGIPAKQKAALQALRQQQSKEKELEREKRQTFDLLLKLAGEDVVQTPHGPEPAMKQIRTSQGVRAGSRTSGYQWTKSVGKMLTAGLIDDIEGWMRRHQRRFPFFQAVAVVTEYTKAKFKGYKGRMKQRTGIAESGDFAMQSKVATHRDKALGAVVDELRQHLEEALEEGALVFVHAVTLFNYRLRTDEERLAWEALQRRRRAKRKQRTWTRTKPTSKKSSLKKKSKTKATPSKKPAPKPQKASTIAKRGALHSKSFSTRSQPSRSKSKPAKGSASTRTTSASRSPRTTSKSFGKKQKSSSTTGRKVGMTLARKVGKKTTKTKTKTKTKKAKR